MQRWNAAPALPKKEESVSRSSPCRMKLLFVGREKNRTTVFFISTKSSVLGLQRQMPRATLQQQKGHQQCPSTIKAVVLAGNDRMKYSSSEP